MTTSDNLINIETKNMLISCKADRMHNHNASYQTVLIITVSRLMVQSILRSRVGVVVLP